MDSLTTRTVTFLFYFVKTLLIASLPVFFSLCPKVDCKNCAFISYIYLCVNLWCARNNIFIISLNNINYFIDIRSESAEIEKLGLNKMYFLPYCKHFPNSPK